MTAGVSEKLMEFNLLHVYSKIMLKFIKLLVPKMFCTICLGRLNEQQVTINIRSSLKFEHLSIYLDTKLETNKVLKMVLTIMPS